MLHVFRGCCITTCYPLALCHAPMSLDTHLMGLLWGQCASRAKLPFSVCASVITLTSDLSDMRRPDRQSGTASRLNWSGGNRTLKSYGVKYKSFRALLACWCLTKSMRELKGDDAELKTAQRKRRMKELTANDEDFLKVTEQAELSLRVFFFQPFAVIIFLRLPVNRFLVNGGPRVKQSNAACLLCQLWRPSAASIQTQLNALHTHSRWQTRICFQRVCLFPTSSRRLVKSQAKYFKAFQVSI